MAEPPTLAEQIAEVTRECIIRESVYASQIRQGKLKPETAAARIRIMQQVLATLQGLQAQQQTAA